jgi:outer membrane receptor protein involved in Fe transport
MLTADVSGRYDNYSFAGTDAGKFTYKAGLELRPLDTLLFRGNYATAFRAPDLVNIFGSTGFYTTDTDYYLCRLAGYGPTNYDKCPQGNTQFFGTNGSSSNLDDITAKTWTYGGVYSPIEHLTFTADYQHVQIKNEVTQLSTDQLLQDEADCLIGMTVGGQTIDPNSPSCQLYKSLVGRAPATSKTTPNGILTVTTYPINASSEKEDGIIAGANYLLDVGRFGSLAFDVHYYIEFEHLFQQFPGDPVINVYHDPRFSDWKSTVNSSLTWNVDKWTTTIFNQRYGSIPNAGQTGRLPPWSLWNASLKYAFDSGASVQLTSNNVFNKKPPVDKTASVFPYYNTYNYNPYGRAVWAEFAYRWGGSKE